MRIQNILRIKHFLDSVHQIQVLLRQGILFKYGFFAYPMPCSPDT